MRTVVSLMALVVLAGCGGSRYSSDAAVGRFAPAPVLFATGPIQKACLADGRRGASQARCGCVQAVADQTLSWSEQRTGVKVFRDPHRLQEMRQSDNARDNAFWSTWKAFGQSAAAACSRT
ncbi:hypothetical protein [Sulfitobacter maritimus]|uniref:hypothetical protein n=1 Tax=Sulfitobacter maritimus TaxID=2741719 RepID=UPI001FEC1B12|nr:hypothetical protein [Sulfitobacter maritimus]